VRHSEGGETSLCLYYKKMVNKGPNQKVLFPKEWGNLRDNEENGAKDVGGDQKAQGKTGEDLGADQVDVKILVVGQEEKVDDANETGDRDSPPGLPDLVHCERQHLGVEPRVLRGAALAMSSFDFLDLLGEKLDKRVRNAQG